VVETHDLTVPRSRFHTLRGVHEQPTTLLGVQLGHRNPPPAAAMPRNRDRPVRVLHHPRATPPSIAAPARGLRNRRRPIDLGNQTNRQEDQQQTAAAKQDPATPATTR
jgi:hypothetical protein